MVTMRVVPLLIFAFAVPVFSQEDDASLRSLMTRRSLSCYDIRLNCLDLIPAYMAAGKRDSAVLLLNYWENECDRDPVTVRTRLLFAIDENRFTEQLYDEGIIANLLFFREELNSPGRGYERDGEMERAQRTYTTFTTLLAHGSLGKTQPGTPEYLLARHYSGSTDSTFNELQSAGYAGTPLRRYYDERVRSVLSAEATYIGLSLGLWEPVSGELRPMGRHPEIGLFYGKGNNSWDLNLHVFLHLGDARDPYTYTYLGNRLTTRDFFGGGVGFEAGRKVVYRPHEEFSLIFGGTIESYTPPQPESEQKKGVNSFHLTLGTSYGFRPQAYGGSQMNLQLRYNAFLFGSEELGGPMGSFLSLRFMTSFTLDDHRQEELENLSFR